MLIEYIDKKGYIYTKCASMKNYTTFKIGGPCKLLITPFNSSQIKDIILQCKNMDIKYYILGRGSNLLIDDSGIDGVVIFLGNKFSNISLINDNTIQCDSGTPLAKLCYFAYQNGLSGLEFAWGIPGSVGGAIYMNAGAYGGEIKDVISKSYHFDLNGELGCFDVEQLNLSYRRSIYSNKNYCITKSFFVLQKKDKQEIKLLMDDIISRRIQKQPIEYPSAGSIFKRPKGSYAGYLISECGLKGYRIGGAMVSDKHAGFIINYDNASCNDVLRLIDHIKETVLLKTGYELECEVKKI